MSSKAYEYVNRYYGLQVKPGMRVMENDGKRFGVVIRKRCYDHRVHVRLDGMTFALPFHPYDLNYSPSATQTAIGEES